MDPTSARERRWWNQLRCGTSASSAEAGFALAALLCDRGRDEEAETILRECSNTASDSIAAAATIRLARLIERRQGPAAAEATYEQAADRASPVASGDVLIDLAGRWAARGELSRARHAYRAVDCGCPDPRLRAVACYRLGTMKREAGLLHEAIRAWERGLGDAQDALRIHLLVSLAEALLEQTVDHDRVEALLAEAIESDHPDLAPRAALCLAQLKRASGEFIDAYRLAHLVVDSRHPVFAAEGAAECEHLAHGELNTLFELNWPSSDQLELSEGSPKGKSGRRLYVPILSAELSQDTQDPWADYYRRCLNESLAGGSDRDEREFWICHHSSDRGTAAVGALPWSAFFARLDKGDLSAINKAMQRGCRRVVQAKPYGGFDCRSIEHFPTRPDRRALRGRGEDLEFLILLRAAVWLRSEAVPGVCGLLQLQHQFIFDCASERLTSLPEDGECWRAGHHSLALLTLAGGRGEWHLPGTRASNLALEGSEGTPPRCRDDGFLPGGRKLSTPLVFTAAR